MHKQVLSAIHDNKNFPQNNIMMDNFPSIAQEDRNNSSHSIKTVENFTTLSTNATKFLSLQIPNFGGTDQENVELWIEKIESIAEVHGLPPVAMLSAATFKLNKVARKWFALVLLIDLGSTSRLLLYVDSKEE